jgi:predicted deacylase
VLSYVAETGDLIRRGDTVAWLIEPAAEEPESGRRAICAGTDGLILSRRVKKYVRAGWSVAKIVGDVPLQTRAPGALLEH